jgi:predicted negative regulator of RcsB-dependent stress response
MPAAFDAEQLLRRFNAINERLREIEAHLVVLSEKAGVDYTPPADEVPADVAKLAAEGKTLEAMKAYRQATGADADKARDVVLGL